jgi:thiol-disulfide isomerase/thioredoxin
MPNQLLVSSAVLAICLVASEATARSYKGKAFPDFKATDAITGDKFSLSDLRGKVVLVDFWATWCGPCIKELPNLTRAYSQYHKQGFEIVSISLDSDRQRFKKFVRSKRMTWYHVMEGGAWKTRLAGKYAITSIPRMYVLDPAGNCIAENVRGRDLESAIERGLKMVGNSKAPTKRTTTRKPRRSKRRTDRPPPTKPIELVAARAQLAAAAAPLEEFDSRLESLETELEALGSQLPAPRDPYATRKRLELAMNGLADARHTAFLMGLLAGRQAPVVPGNSPATTTDVGRSWTDLIPLLEAARDWIMELREAVGDVTDQLDAIKIEIRQLEKELTRGRPAEGRVDEIEARIAGVASELDGPWAAQVETARLMVAECCLPFDEALDRIDGLAGRIEAVRAMLDAEPRETSDLRALRAAFASVCADLESTSTLMEPDGQIAMTLPVDPFAGRRLKDRRILSAMATQVDLADAAVATFRTQVAQRRERFDGLIQRVATLQQELSDRLDTGGSVDDLREQFSDLSRDVLALHDPSL